MQLVVGTQVDRWVVEGLIGRGGMASVYQVRHAQLGTVHALKILEVSNVQLRERLMREGRVQAALDHPNVVPVTDVIDAGGVTGLLMQYVRGPTLDRLLQHGRLPLEQVDALVPGILAGVAAAHAANVVHRDLKPANILLQTRRTTVIPKVADFGLVKLVGGEDAGRTRSGAMMGTPHYMSPEQIRATKDVDHRTDLFALGAILYELATGVRAYAGEATFEIFERITRGDHRPTTEVAPELPDRMHQAIEAALQLDPGDRVASCEALWALWAGEGAPNLNVAAETTVVWSQAPLLLLEALSPSSLALDPTPAATVSLGNSHSSSLPIVEGAARRVAPPPAAKERARGSWKGAAALLVGLASLAALLMWELQPRPIAPTATVAPDPAPPGSPAPQPALPDPALWALPDPALSAAPAPSALPDPTPPGAASTPPPVPPSLPIAPTRARPAPAPAPVPAPPAAVPTATVRRKGSADAVWLVSMPGGLRVELGAVPAGVYAVHARFADRETVEGTYSFAAGESWTIQCEAGMAKCTSTAAEP